MRLQRSRSVGAVAAAAFAVFCVPVCAASGAEARDLGARLAALQARSPVPGFCVALVDADGIRYSAGFGQADRASGRAYTADTVQDVASISKTLIGVAVMQAVEDGVLSLDEDLRRVLPFEVSNPRFPGAPVTLAELATHTAGIVDRQPFYEHSYYSGTQTAFSLQSFLAAYLDRGGRFYSRDNFGTDAPGESYAYSNIGATLAAYAVERVRGLSYARYVHARIFAPLGMRTSGWSPADANAVAATLYDEYGQIIAPYSYAGYADGGVFTSCNDLGRFLSAMIAGYAGRAGVLQPASFRAMFAARFAATHRPRGLAADEIANEGVFWQISERGEIGHVGGDPGVSTSMFFDPHTGLGRILLANVSNDGLRPAVARTLQAAWSALAAQAREAARSRGSPARPDTSR